MERFHCINIVRICIVLLLFFYTAVVEVTGQDAMIQTANFETARNSMY